MDFYVTFQQNFLNIVLPVIIGFLIDAIIGDPKNFPHPVRIIGKGIEAGEKILRKPAGKNDTKLYFAGLILSISIVALAFITPFLILHLAGQISGALKIAVASVFCWQAIAMKSLKTESMKVYEKLKNSDVNGARNALSHIVGRDTAHLSERGVTRAAVETVSENLSDGVIAPMIYLFIGGAPLGFAYKAINTLDSMIGYDNEKYRYFGRYAARLDDLANFIPARISAFLLLAAGGFPGNGADIKRGCRIFKRDRFNHKSPNSAQTEAVCAGLLGVRLAGDAVYGGRLVKKPTIGDAVRQIEAEDIKRANRLMYLASFTGAVVFSGIAALLIAACAFAV